MTTNGTYSRAVAPNGSTIYDYYRFSAKHGDTLDVELTAHLASSSLLFILRDAFGAIVLASDWLNDGETYNINKTIHRDGLYYLTVSGSGKGTYDLIFSGAEAEADTDGDGLTTSVEYFHRTDPLNSDTDGGGASDLLELSYGASPLAIKGYLDTEVGKSIDTASILPYMNQPINAEYIANNENDHWYSFNLAEGEGVTVALEAHLNNTSGLLCTLYNPSRELVLTTDWAYDGDIVTLSHQVSDQKSGTYYLKISGSVYGNYNLTVNSAWYNDGVTDNQRDFYSTYETARLLVNGTYTLPVMPNGRSMRHYYRFSVQSGDVLDISISPRLHDGSIMGTIYDKDHILISVTSWIDDGETVSLKETINSPGTYFLQISGTGKGEYDLGGITQNDFDNDGLMDDYEVSIGTDPTNPDTDGDGVSDDKEVSAGTDPLDENSSPFHWPMFMPAIIGR